MKEIIKRYTDDKLTVVWQPSKCSHSKICFHGLPEVFNPENRPWVKLEQSANEDIIAQVRKCPSGALSIEGEDAAESTDCTAISVTKGGPLLVEGRLMITLPNGETNREKGHDCFMSLWCFCE